MKIVYYRSAAYCCRLAIERGKSYPQQITIEIDPEALSKEARDVLVTLQGDGTYPGHVHCLGYSREYVATINYSGWGRGDFACDTDPDDTREYEILSSAIVEAHRIICQKRADQATKIAEVESIRTEIESLRARVADAEQRLAVAIAVSK